MPRLQPVASDSADAPTRTILDGAKKKLGRVPNIVATMANSPAVAQGYLAFSGALAEGSLPASTRERIALAVSEANACRYCLAAHTALGRSVGLTDEEARAARQGKADDPKTQAALRFAQRLVETRGFATDDDLQAARSAGLTDGEIAEVVAHVALNVFTNYFNHVAETEVDFPAVEPLVVSN